MEGRMNRTGHKAACSETAKSKNCVVHWQSVGEMNYKNKQRKTSKWKSKSINLISSKIQRKNKQRQMKETGEKWTVNSKWVDDTVIPLILPKTALLQVFERDVRMIYVYIWLKEWEREFCKITLISLKVFGKLYWGK